MVLNDFNKLAKRSTQSVIIISTIDPILSIKSGKLVEWIGDEFKMLTKGESVHPCSPRLISGNKKDHIMTVRFIFYFIKCPIRLNLGRCLALSHDQYRINALPFISFISTEPQNLLS